MNIFSTLIDESILLTNTVLSKYKELNSASSFHCKLKYIVRMHLFDVAVTYYGISRTLAIFICLYSFS